MSRACGRSDEQQQHCPRCSTNEPRHSLQQQRRRQRQRQCNSAISIYSLTLSCQRLIVVLCLAGTAKRFTCQHRHVMLATHKAIVTCIRIRINPDPGCWQQLRISSALLCSPFLRIHTKEGRAEQSRAELIRSYHRQILGSGI